MPKLERELDPATIAAQVAADTAFGRELERALPANTMVFQLPVVSFPEAETIYQLGEYEHFRPYLATDNLRFSFGATKLRARSRWQRELQALPLPELVGRLEDYGFGAIYLNRKGFADGGEQALRELAALGCTHRVESGGDQIAVLLRPAHETIPPIATGMTYGVGWQPRAEEGWRWAYDDAALAYFNPYDHPIFVELRLEVRADGERELQLEHEDSVIRRVHLKGTPEALVISRVELEPGVNRFKLSSDAPPVRRHEGRNQLRAFGVAEKSVRVVVQNTAPPLPEFARLGQL
jgi:phosphoglycerol transferase